MFSTTRCLIAKNTKTKSPHLSSDAGFFIPFIGYGVLTPRFQLQIADRGLE